MWDKLVKTKVHRRNGKKKGRRVRREERKSAEGREKKMK